MRPKGHFGQIDEGGLLRDAIKTRSQYGRGGEKNSISAGLSARAFGGLGAALRQFAKGAWGMPMTKSPALIRLRLCLPSSPSFRTAGCPPCWRRPSCTKRAPVRAGAWTEISGCSRPSNCSGKVTRLRRLPATRRKRRPASATAASTPICRISVPPAVARGLQPASRIAKQLRPRRTVLASLQRRTNQPQAFTP